MPVASNSLALGALLALAVAHAAQYSWYTIDDAFITFRYARHLVDGLGAVFNPGTFVKGYSNTPATPAQPSAT